MKKRYVVGNWKMHKTSLEAVLFIENFLQEAEAAGVCVYLAAPFTAIHAAMQIAKGTPLVIGAQNMHDAKEGAFTGEVSSLMLKEAGASFVLLGHSERRMLFGESDAFIHRKLIRALQDDIEPILCVGEADGEELEAVLSRQLRSAFAEVPLEGAAKVLIAYEPVWAIGSGKTAKPAHVEKAHGMIRSILKELLGKKTGMLVPILYGGSVKADNVSEIMEKDDVDGVLVGGASLSAVTLSQIVRNMVEK